MLLKVKKSLKVCTATERHLPYAITQWVSEYSFTSHSKHNRLFRDHTRVTCYLMEMNVPHALHLTFYMPYDNLQHVQ